MQGVKDMNRKDEFYVNVADLMKRVLPRPQKKPDIPIITVECGIWSPITW